MFRDLINPGYALKLENQVCGERRKNIFVSASFSCMSCNIKHVLTSICSYMHQRLVKQTLAWKVCANYITIDQILMFTKPSPIFWIVPDPLQSVYTALAITDMKLYCTLFTHISVNINVALLAQINIKRFLANYWSDFNLPKIMYNSLNMKE